MVFTMNTFVMAEEATVEAAENEPAIVEEVGGEVAVEGATEDGAIVEGAENVDDVIEIVDVADVEADDAVDAVDAGDEENDAVVEEGAAEEGDDAVIDEVDEYGEVDDAKSDLASAGWALTGSDTTGLKYASGKLTLASSNDIYLEGTTDSTSIEIGVDDSKDLDDYDTPWLHGLTVKAGKEGKKLTVTVLSSNKIAKALYEDDEEATGYYWVGDIATNGAERVKKELEECVEDEDEVKVTVDTSGYPNKVVATYELNEASLKANNQPFGEKTATAGSAKVTYYENVPFYGIKNPKIDSSTLKSILGKFNVSANGSNLTIKKITLKRNKNSNTAVIKKVTFTTKAKDIQKAIKSANITIKIYPWNLEKAVPEGAKLSGKSGKYTFSGKIAGKKFSFKQGKSDKMGSTTTMKKDGGKLTVSNNAFVGSVSTNKITDKSK